MLTICFRTLCFAIFIDLRLERRLFRGRGMVLKMRKKNTFFFKSIYLGELECFKKVVRSFCIESKKRGWNYKKCRKVNFTVMSNNGWITGKNHKYTEEDIYNYRGVFQLQNLFNCKVEMYFNHRNKPAKCLRSAVANLNSVCLPSCRSCSINCNPID